MPERNALAGIVLEWHPTAMNPARRSVISAILFLSVSFSLTGFSATNDSPVRSLGIISSYNDSARIFDKSVRLADLERGVGIFLQHTIDACRSNATVAGKSPQSIGSMGGSWLEWATLIALRESNIGPSYWQAEFTKVPDNFNDVTLWSQEHGPVIISCKTSLRERYKQADLEAVALRQFYPKGKFFLLTLDNDKTHLARTRKKIIEKDLLALQAIYAPDNVDELFAFLKSASITNAPDSVLRKAKIVR
jgi:hypothetical protein